MDLLWLVPLAPLAGSLILLLTEGRLDKRLVGIVGAGSVGLSAVIAFVVGLEFQRSGLSSHTYEMWTWMDVGGLRYIYEERVACLDVQLVLERFVDDDGIEGLLCRFI